MHLLNRGSLTDGTVGLSNAVSEMLHSDSVTRALHLVLVWSEILRSFAVFVLQPSA
jgi:hypothetical protein